MKSKLYLLIFVVMLIGCSELNKKMDLLDIDEKYNEGHIHQAKLELEEYLRLNKSNEYAWTLLGHMNEDLDEDSMGMVAYEKALKINPDTEEALTGMGIVARKKKDYNKATEYYLKAIEINPEYAIPYANLLVIKLKQKKFSEAVELGLKGYNIDKENPVIITNLCIAYHYDGDTIKRDELYNKAVELGYEKLETLKQIFDDEVTVFD
ncbi:MAG: tetratricopeptide repeat protein [bacterium]|nr:tetratricopeptide repeat protein [bacterium]